MHVRMMHQVLTPRVEHHQTTDLCSQMLRIGGNLQQSLGCRTKQDAVDHTFVLKCQRSQFVRQREDHVEVRYGKQFALPLLQPDSTSHRLALGTVSVAAGVVLNPLVTTVAALLDMSTQLCCPATDHRAQHLTLLAGERVPVLGAEAVLSIAEDIGDFQRSTHHAASSSESGGGGGVFCCASASSSAAESSSNSIGLGASRSPSIEMCV